MDERTEDEVQFVSQVNQGMDLNCILHKISLLPSFTFVSLMQVCQSGCK